MSDLDLATLQTGLLHLIKGRAACEPFTDDYLRRVAGCSQLEVVREIVQWWCRQTVMAAAPFTGRLLARLQRLDLATAELSGRDDLTPFRSAQTLQCLSGLGSDSNPLLAALADFECHVLVVAARPNEGPFRTDWPCDPYKALHALLHGTALPPVGNEIYVTEVGAAIPGFFRVLTTAAPG